MSDYCEWERSRNVTGSCDRCGGRWDAYGPAPLECAMKGQDILRAVPLIAVWAERAQEASSEQEARRALKEIWDIADRCLSNNRGP